MPYSDHRDVIARLSAQPSQIRWCAERTFVEENANGSSPGEFLNRYGFEVVATTIGGNAITRHTNGGPFYFASHTWFFDDLISFEDDEGEWHDIPMSADNLMRALRIIADSESSFYCLMIDGQLDELIDKLD